MSGLVGRCHTELVDSNLKDRYKLMYRPIIDHVVCAKLLNHCTTSMILNCDHALFTGTNNLVRNSVPTSILIGSQLHVSPSKQGQVDHVLMGEVMSG